MFNSLQRRFTLIFITLTALPLVVISLLVGFISFRNLGIQAQERLEDTSESVSAQISNFITARTQELNLLISLTGLPDDEAPLLLENLLFKTDVYQDIALLNPEGDEIFRAARAAVIETEDLVSRANEPEFTSILQGNEVYYSQVVFDPQIREPLMTVSVPVFDLRSGDLRSVLVAEFRFRPIWQFLTDLDLDGGTTVFVVESNTGEIVAHPDPSVVLRGTQYTLPDEANMQGSVFSEDNVFNAQVVLRLADEELIVIAEQPISEALLTAAQLRNLTAIIAAVALIIAVIIVAFVVRQVVKPIEDLSSVAQQIEAGNLDMRADVKTQDEIGDLANAFNSMTNQLSDLIDNLEHRVQARTRDLEVAADVSKQVANILLLEDLLPILVERTREGFSLYNVSIFLYDEPTEALKLESATGIAGHHMLAEGRSFKLSDVGIVPTAGRTRKPALANDVSATDNFFPNPFLPATKAELSIPMIVGDTLIGVLDLQSETVNAFSDDDLRVLQSLAEQLGVAVQNARLYANQLSITDELRRVDDMKSQFLASMSHELRTPLNAILNFTQFVKSGKLGPINDVQEETLAKTVSSGEHLLSLINDVLDVAKIEAGMMELFIEEEIDLRREIETAIAAGETILVDKPIKLHVDVPEFLPMMVGDRRRIRQIMLNLVSNACKYTEEGDVFIRATVDESNFQFIVEDTGVGIAQEDQSLIFEPFRQTRDGLRKSGGTGLGLAISRKLAEEHFGNLTFTSEVGKGSRFVLSLPIRATELLALV